MGDPFERRDLLIREHGTSLRSLIDKVIYDVFAREARFKKIVVIESVMYIHMCAHAAILCLLSFRASHLSMSITWQMPFLSQNNDMKIRFVT